MIHRYTAGPLEPDPWVTATLRNFGDVTDWTDDLLPSSVVEWLDSLADRVRPEDRWRHRANLVRLWLLHNLGGVWVDHDVILFEPVESWPRPFMAAHGSVCNCVMGFDAGHPMLAAALDAVESARGERSADVSGERLLQRVLTPDVERVPLPFDSSGRRIAGSRAWCVHLFRSGALL